MVNRRKNVDSIRRMDGSMLMELIVAIGILALAVVPLGFFLVQEQRLCPTYYQRAVAMEIVDGEMEILTAGEWKKFKRGVQNYSVKAESAKNLPPGHFTLRVEGKRMQLEWIPTNPGKSGKVSREILMP